MDFKLLFLLVLILAIYANACCRSKRNNRCQTPCRSRTSLLRPLLIGKAVIAAKLAAPAVAIGAAALLRSRRRRCRSQCTTTTCVNHVNRTPFRTRTSSSISNVLHRTSKSLQNYGNRGINLLDSTANGLKTISIVSRNLLPRSKRQARYNQNYGRNNIPNLANKKMTLDQMFKFIKQNNAEMCLQKVICELSANSRIYGDEGLKFGASLMAYNKVDHPDAESYRLAAKYGNQHRNRPSFCSKKFSKCTIDAKDLITVGNSII